MPNFTYSRNFPDGNLTPASQRSTLTTNTNSVDSILDVDLIGFNDNDGGFHQKSTYVVQLSDPGSAAGQIVEYSKSSGGSSELFIQRDNVATAIQLTKGTVNITGDATTPPAKGHSFLPGGLIIQWGSVTAQVAGQAFTFDVNFTSIFAITMAIQAIGAQSCAFSSVGTGGAIAYSQSGPQTINYIAIGT